MLTHQFLREVGAVARCVQSLSDVTFKKLTLQRGQFVFLTRICENPGIHLLELSHLLKVDKATTTKAVQKLAAEGYVRKVQNAEDKRMYQLFPTVRAEKVYPELIAEENRYLVCCFAGMTKEEQALAETLLRRIRENIEAEWLVMKTGKGGASHENS